MTMQIGFSWTFVVKLINKKCDIYTQQTNLSRIIKFLIDKPERLSCEKIYNKLLQNNQR